MTELETRIVKFVKENSPVTASEVAYALTRDHAEAHRILKKLIREGHISHSDIKSRVVAVKTAHALTKTGKRAARFITVKNVILAGVFLLIEELIRAVAGRYLEVIINRFMDMP